jgi:hypothetical protein
MASGIMYEVEHRLINRVVRKLHFPNKFRWKQQNASDLSLRILQDLQASHRLAENQPGSRTSLISPGEDTKHKGEL